MKFFQVPETSSSNQNVSNHMQSSSATIMTGSNFSYDTEDIMCEKQSDDDNLETLRMKAHQLQSLITDAVTSTTSSANSSNITVVNKKYITKTSSPEYRTESGENNNNIVDTDEDEFCSEKKFNYSARVKRYALQCSFNILILISTILALVYLFEKELF